MNPLDKIYQPQEIEKTCYAEWEAKGYFAPSHAKASYCIIFPPPNVTGSLHMGHGFGATLMDILIRYHRMLGENTLWQTGTDHAGIATQMVVERKLNAQGETRHSIGREAFIKKIWEWKQESGDQIEKQLRRLGASMDWDQACFTMDEGPSYAVREVFIRLYEEGLIYKGKRLVNWDPVLLTAISDLEVINQEEEGKLWYIRYPLVDHEGHLIVATTRPETLLGDVAVAVHPDDERYQALIGTCVQLPLTERTIPIIADDSVDPEFGTGCVKITPAHDFNDYAIGNRHQLSPINILTPTAHLNENVPLSYQGLSRFDAREKILEDLKALNLIEKIDTHRLKVPRGDRSGTIIEPYLTYQWYVKSKPLAEPAIQAVKQGDIKFIPENWDKTYFQWMDNIEDWCISRQLWWGHRIPVWYDETGNPYVGHDEADVRARHQLSADVRLSQDEDVLDTWFSSALWPLSSLGWPLQTEKLNTFFPTQVLVTGFDIIFFWVARMIMMSLKFTGKIPFHHVYITGLIRDAEGHKMSKSKGNVLDPIDLIDGIDLDALIQKRTYGLMQPKMATKIESATRKEFKEGIPAYGTDALRFTFCSVATHTRDIRFDTNRLGGYRNFCNKLWNAARYVMMNTEGYDLSPVTDYSTLSLPDRWILSKLQNTIQQAHEALAQYRFDFFAQLLYDFIWNEFCDWYLELSKPTLLSKDTSPEIANGTRYTLVHVLETLLRLLHPIMPFITETLWQRIAPLAKVKGASIMLATYPQVNDQLHDDIAVRDLEWIKLFITAIRTIRSEMNISPAKSIAILLKQGSLFDHQQIEHHQHFLKVLAKIDNISWLKTNEAPPFAASAFLGELEIFIPMAGLIDKKEEMARLDKEMMKIEKDMVLTDKKLNNPQFVEKAPVEVISKEKIHYSELKMLYEKLKAQHLHLSELPE